MTYNNLIKEGGRKRKSLKKRGPKKSKLARKSKKAGETRITFNPFAGEDTNIRLAIRDCIRNINARRKSSNFNISNDFYQIDKKLYHLNGLLNNIKCDNGRYLKDKVERISRGTRYTGFIGHNKGTESIKNAMKTLIATINSVEKYDAIYYDYKNNTGGKYNNIKDFETDNMNNIMTNVCSNNNPDYEDDQFHNQNNNDEFTELPRDTGGIWDPNENNDNNLNAGSKRKSKKSKRVRKSRRKMTKRRRR